VWRAALPDLDPDDVRLAVQRFHEELWVGFFPDAVPTLDTLVDDVPLGVLSNNPYLHREVERLRLNDWIEVAVDLPLDRHKPHPEAFARALAATGTAPRRTAYVGDSLAQDVEGALAAGMVAVWVDRWDEPCAAPPGAHRLAHLAELPALLASL
jgi:HAD superfamily hydrolase (TIGR01509 family)